MTAVRVRIGALSGISGAALRFAWNLAAEQTVAAGSELQIEDVPLAVTCSGCGEQETTAANAGLACPTCGSVATTVVRGRELQLVAMEVVDG